MISLGSGASILTLAQVEAMVQEVRALTLPHDEYEMQSNPVRDACERMLLRVTEAARRVAAEGQAVLVAAAEQVVQEWENIRRDLGEQAREVLLAFQAQIGTLIAKAIQAIATAVAVILEPVPGLALDTLAFKQAWAVSPSVGTSVTDWLRLTVTSCAEVTLSYKVAPSTVADPQHKIPFRATSEGPVWGMGRHRGRRNRVTAMGRYGKLSIATPMDRTEL
jgi:hypothetical protein